MLILGACGTWRSGSTAQYNMIRLICDEAGVEYELIKSHVADRKLYREATAIFTTDRDMDEIKESLKAFGRVSLREGNPNYKRTFVYAYKQLKFWKSHHNNLHQEYEDIIGNTKECIRQIAEHLKLEVDVDKVYEKFLEVKPPKDKYDPVTKLFPNHRR